MNAPHAAAPSFPYDHPTMATVWAREAPRIAREQIRALHFRKDTRKHETVAEMPIDVFPTRTDT